MKKYLIKKELMGGDWYYMIYVKIFWLFPIFYERWNDLESATIRLNELNNKNK